MLVIDMSCICFMSVILTGMQLTKVGFIYLTNCQFELQGGIEILSPHPPSQFQSDSRRMLLESYSAESRQLRITIMPGDISLTILLVTLQYTLQVAIQFTLIGFRYHHLLRMLKLCI